MQAKVDSLEKPMPPAAQQARWRRRLAAAAALLLLFAVAALAWKQFRAPAASQLLEQAEQAAARRDFVTAQSLLDRVLADQPNSFPARLLMAQVARRAGYVAEARVQLDIAAALRVERDKVDLEGDLLEMQEGDLSRERRLWAIALDDADQALFILEALARGYRKNYLLADMQVALDELLRRQPDHVEALLDRAWIAERQVRLDKALDDLKQAVAIDPRHDEANLRLGELLLAMERPPEAYEILKPLAARHDTDPRVVLALFRACRKMGKSDEAAQLDSQLSALKPAEFPVLLERGRYLLEQGGAAEAEPLLRQAVALAPFDFQVHYSLQLCLNQLDRQEEAKKEQALVQQIDADLKEIAELTQKLQRARFDPDLRCAIARIFLRSGEESEGLRWLKTVLRMQPQHRPTHEALAEYYERHGQPSLAEQHRRQAANK